MKQHEAETIALNVLSFLLSEEERRERFMTLSGIDPQLLGDNVAEPAFLAGILDYLLQDETLIYVFCDEYNATPDCPARARRSLVGNDDHGGYN